MGFKVTTPPSVEPLLITDPVVKQALRVIDSNEDTYLSMLLTMAREAAEQITWRALITQGITLSLDKFPSPGLETASANWYGPAWGVSPGPLTTTRQDGSTGYEIWLPRAPLQSVASITYYDDTGTLQTLSPAAYLVDNVSEPGRVVPASGSTWPSTANRPNAVQVTYTAGYGASGAAVPQSILHWILLMTATMYENRELVAVLSRGRLEELPYVASLLTRWAVRTHNAPSYWL